MSVMRIGSTTPATSRMEFIVTMVKDWKPLKIVTKSSILDVTEVVDPIWAVS